MTLYMTHDGMFGWEVDGRLKWFNSEYQARVYGLIQFDYNSEDEDEVNKYMREFDVALEIMREKRHTKAEFGILGSFMYTVGEEDE